MAHVATITIDHTKVAGDLTDYVGFIAPDASAGYSALYALCLEGGGDIRLFKSDDTTELAREIVSFSVSAETGEIHYRYAGTLSSSVDTAIHVYADGSSSEPSAGATYGSEAVWADYGLVSHDGGATDSTGNNSITANGSISSGATGKIGIGTDFPGGSTDYYNAPANSSYGAVGTSSVSITVSSWFKRTSAQNRFAALFRFGDDYQYFLQFQNTGGTNLVFGIKDFSDGTQTSGEVATGTGAFEYYVGVADHVADVISLYKNGSLGASNSTTVSFRAGSNLLLIGQQSVGLSRILDGIADEMRISKTANSATWIETEYNNQNSYSTFYSVAAVGGGSAAQAARRGAVMMM